MKRKWKRRNYFVKRDLQGKYLFISFVFAVTELVLFAILLGVAQTDKLTISYDNNSLRVAKAPLALFEQVLGAHWVFIVAGGLAVGLASLLITHRFAGPMYRFEKTLEGMIQGDFTTRVRLRAHDEGKELAGLLNRFTDDFSSTVREMREHTSTIQAALGRASKIRETAEVEASVGRADEAGRRLAEILDRYELCDPTPRADDRAPEVESVPKDPNYG